MAHWNSDLKMPSRMVTAAELAAALNCSTRSITRACNDGRLPRPLKIGRLVRWPADTVRHLIDAMTD